jgi:hypothetical protein
VSDARGDIRASRCRHTGSGRERLTQESSGRVRRWQQKRIGRSEEHELKCRSRCLLAQSPLLQVQCSALATRSLTTT